MQGLNRRMFDWSCNVLVSWKNDVTQIIKMISSEQYHALDAENMKDRSAVPRKELSTKLFLLVALFTVVMSTLDSLVHYRVSRKIVAYYIYLFVHSIVQFGFLHVVLTYQRQRTRFFKWQGTSKWSNCWLLLLLHVIVVYFYEANASFKTTNGGGSEFFQISAALTIPAVIAWSNQLLPKKINGIITTLLSYSVAIQMVVFCKDRAMSSSVFDIIGCMVYSTAYGLYMVILKISLGRDSILQLMYLFSFVEIPLHALLVVWHSDGVYLAVLTSIENLLMLVITGFLKMVSALLFLKMSDPLTCVLTVDLFLIPNTLYKVFHYKLELYLSTFKSFFFVLINLIINAFKNIIFTGNEPVSLG